jgi:hypothetical protein
MMLLLAMMLMMLSMFSHHRTLYTYLPTTSDGLLQHIDVCSIYADDIDEFDSNDDDSVIFLRHVTSPFIVG